MIKFMQGDLLQQQVDAIVNAVNCAGIMSKGIALQFKNEWPQNHKAYVSACKREEVCLGKMFVCEIGDLLQPQPKFIINFPSKKHWRSKSKLADIESGLQDLVKQINKLQIKSIAIPPVGCGLGGLNWNIVKPLMQKYLAELSNVEILIFEPNDSIKPPAKPIKKNLNMTLCRAAILLLLDTYRQLVDKGTSKSELQKLVYFLQFLGIDFKLEFKKDKYGPYADALRHALDNMQGSYIEISSAGKMQAVAPALESAKQFVAKDENIYTWQLEMRVFSK
jgi:O-acetyl-ADP-ribose deacetylase (regulator of RNase III)